MKNDWVENVGVFIREKVWLEPNLLPYKYPNILKASHSSYLSAYEDVTDRVFRNVSGITPKKTYNMFHLLYKDQLISGAYGNKPGLLRDKHQ
jgi:hypothetical protein